MRNRFFFGFKFILFAAVAFFLAGGVTMLLWNWLMPAIFGLTTLTLLQAFGLLVLARILVGGFGRGGRHWGGRHNHPFWMRKMREKMENMTPEERERWKQKLQDHWHEGGHRPWNWDMPTKEPGAEETA